MPEDPVIYEPNEPEVSQPTVAFLHTKEYPVHKLRDVSQIDDKTWGLLSDLFKDVETEVIEDVLLPGIPADRTEYLRGVIYLARRFQALRAEAKQLMRDLAV